MSIKITCLVENSVALSSRFWGEHGMSVLIEEGNNVTLFDTGQSGDVLLHNMQELNIDPHSITNIVLSHGHYDHTGGLKALIELIGPRPIYGHPDVFNQRFSERPDGSLKPVDMPFSKESLVNVTWHLNSEVIEVTDAISTTGEIPRLEPLEDEGDERLKVCTSTRCSTMVKDPLKDDMSLVVKTSKGMVVLLGCCHAGVINTLNQIEKKFPNEDIYAMMGGTHLAKASEKRLMATEKRVEKIPKIGFSHCTGLPVSARFLTRYPEQAFVFQVGSVLEF
ncbi:MAG: MBL fold metallo-hydrolase [Pseudomonadota bacterium]|nr:MBL fold metallo-hydrolase [Pseudomonadota bacterium]